MPPRLSPNPESEHAFYELGSRRFEQFARALHEAQPNIAGAKLYGPDGQEQFGVDHYAFRRPEDGGGIEVGQAKAERTFGPGDVRRAADKFLAHWDDHWRDREVHRFILFVGCAIKSRKAADEIIAQHARFDALGVEFLVWDSSSIFDRLHGANVVVRTYLGQDWYERIFGKPSGPLDGLQQDLEKGDLGAFRLFDFVTRLNQAETAEIVELKRRARRGEVRQVIDELERALNSEASKALSASVKAGKLRVLAGLLLNGDDLSRVRRLLDDADSLDGDSTRLRAVLLLETVGAEAALESVSADGNAELAEVRAVALLRSGRGGEAFGELEPFLDGDAVRAETVRLASLAKLLSGERQASVELAERAVALDTESRACEQCLGICLFHRALSPAAEISVGEWPQPVDQPLVDLGDRGRADLERAESIFKALMAGRELEGHRSMVMWHFGVVACMPWRHEETTARLTELQAAGELPTPLIIWALSRALPLDRCLAAAQCDTEIEKDADNLEAIIIRLALANADQDRRAARDILGRHRHVFTQAGHDDLYFYWSAVLDLEARRDVPEEALRAHPWLRLRQAMDVRPKKRRREAIAGVLSEQLEDQGDPRVILASTQMLLDAGWHKSAAKAAPVLVERIGTAEAIATAAHALYRDGQYSRVLAVLENREAFPGGILPVGLERLRTNSLAQTGEIVQARDASLVIAQSTKATDDLWRSIHLQLAIGAAPDALAIYEENADILAEPAPGHIALARAVLRSHPEAASRITRHLSANAPDEFVTAAFDLASKLKLDAERRALTGRIYQLGAAGKAGVTSISMDDLPAMIRERRERFEQAFEKYANGHIPVHVMGAFRPGALAFAYVAPLLQPPDPKIRQTMLSARYGRRPDAERWPENRADVRLFVDLTALLTAHGLGLLDMAETAFRPLRIAPETIQALLDLQSDIEVAQPERIEAIRLVLGRLGDREISERTALAEDSYRVDWELGSDRPRRVLSFHRLADFALQGRSRKEALQIRDELGNTLDHPAAGARPRDGARLQLGPGIAVTLEEVGLLAGLSRRFDIGLEPGDVADMRAAVADAEQREMLARELSLLIHRFREGLEDGTYKTVAPVETEQVDHVSRGFMQLLNALMTEGGIGWFDDRYTNSASNDRFETATTVEIIDALVRYGRLAEDAAYQYRQKLRAARWQFMPPRSDEIVHFMRAATQKGAVAETEDLALLRRATGEALVHRRRLQWPDPAAIAQDIKGEVPFLLDSGHAISGALVAIWNDPNWSLADAEAASEWILDTLEIGLFPTQLIAAGDPRSDYLLGVHIAGLLLNAIQILESNGRKGRQQAYLDWLWRHLIARTLRVRPEIREPLEAMVEDHLTRTEDGVLEERLWLSLAARMLNSTPLPLRVPLLQRPGIRQAFQLSDDGQVTVGTLEFPAGEFWAALVNATAGKPLSIETADGEKATVTLASDDGGEYLQMVCKNRKLRLDCWPRRVASDRFEECRDALLERRFIMDMSLAEIDDLASLLGTIEPRHARVREAMMRSQEAQQHWYTDLDTAVMERRPFAIANLRPDSALKVLRHLRLETDLDAAAERLIGDRGLVVAVRRLGGLPIAPPPAILDAIGQLKGDALMAFLDEVEAETAPPWTQCFLADALLRLGIEEDVEMRVRGWLDQALSERSAALWDLYIALAQFTAAEAFADDDWKRLDARKQLAICWSHASALVEILVAGHVSLEHMLATLSDHRMVSPRILVDEFDKFRGDAANPHAMTVERLKAHVAAPALLQLRTLGAFENWADESLRSLVIHVDEKGQSHPHIRITEASLAPEDALPSRLSAPIGEAVEAIYPGARSLFRDGVESLLIALLDVDQSTIEARAGWTLLRHVSPNGPLSGRVAELANSKRPLLDLTFRGENLLAARLHLINYLGLAAANRWNSQEELDRIDAAIAALGPTEDEDDVGVLFELAFWRALLVEDALERTKFLADAILKLGEHESFRSQAIVAARQFARGLSGQQSEAFIDAMGMLLAAY